MASRPVAKMTTKAVTIPSSRRGGDRHGGTRLLPHHTLRYVSIGSHATSVSVTVGPAAT